MSDEGQTIKGRWQQRLWTGAYAFSAVIALLWNVLFFTIFATTFVKMLEYLASSERVRDIDVDITMGWFACGAMPIAVLTAIAWLGLRPAIALVYGVQAPLVIMAILRLFGARAGTAVTNLAFAIGVLGMAAFAWSVLNTRTFRRGPRWLSSVWLTPTLLVGIWLACLISLFVPPVVAALIEGLVSNLSRPSFIDAGLVLVVCLMAVTAIGIVIVPAALLYLYFRAWSRSIRRGGLKALAASASAAAMVLLSMFVLSKQPQVGVLERLGDPEVSETTEEEAFAIHKERYRIQAGLLNIVLSPYRYLGPKDQMDALASIYKSTGFPEGLASVAQGAQNILLSPMLYDGPGTYDERAQARALYQAVFDKDIEVAHREAFRDALEATWSFRQPDATLLDAAAKTVRLKSQTVQVDPMGPVAEVLLHEVYVNQTYGDREVLYHLELPETAVVTGLWLGPDDNRETAFAHRISPRGAAQAVYKAEVQRRVDPALLEQVGPRQYRLRVYPVVRSRAAGHEARRGPPLHMWLRYRTMAVDGHWPLPRRLESRNVYWDSGTLLTINGVRQSRPADAWLPPGVAADHAPDLPATVVVAGHEVTVGPAAPVPVSLPGRWIVAVDTSGSMATLGDETQAALERLGEVLPADTEVVHTRSPYLNGGPKRMVGLSHWLPLGFGGLSLPEIWRQVQTTVSVPGADGVIVVTDAGDGVQRDAKLENPPEVPVWFVHLGGRPAMAYDDHFIESLQQAGGGVAMSVDEVLRRMAHPKLGRAMVAPSPFAPLRLSSAQNQMVRTPPRRPVRRYRMK